MDSEIKVYRDTFEKDISFWICVKNRYENFHYSVIVDNMKEDTDSNKSSDFFLNPICIMLVFYYYCVAL